MGFNKIECTEGVNFAALADFANVTPISIAKKIKPSIFHKGIVAKFIVRKPINESGRIFANRLSETFAVISNT